MNISPEHLAARLREAEKAHASAEKRLPPHDWAVWYAAFMTFEGVRESSKTAASYADWQTRLSLIPKHPLMMPVG